MAVRRNLELACGFAIFLVVTVTSAAPVGSERRAEVRDSTDGYLPRFVTPNHYELEITTDIYQPQPPFPFQGFVSIYFTCTVQTTIVILNSLNLRIIGIRVFSDPENAVRPPSPILLQWSLDAQANFLIIEVANPFEVGFKYIFDITYDGYINSNGNGLHWRSYTDTDGSTKYLAVTQFQGIAARQMFPCFDEVDLKATFDVTVVSKPPSVTLSNMPVISTTDRGNGWTAYKFDRSPIMSTYQVTIAVGDFVRVETDWRNFTSYPINLYARPQMANNLEFAAYIAPRISAWLEQETGIPYSLPKLDHIAIPEQGWAMENWGLITYAESMLCVDKTVSGAGAIVSSATVVAHEVSHQWYGNLATFKEWDDTWLNEGFATYYNYYPLESLGWPTSEFQQSDKTMPFLDSDQLNTSVPIRKRPNNIWESDSASAGSTYPKGSAVVRQLRQVLTPATLKRGLTKYLTKFSYGSVTTADLWAELNEQAALDGIKNPDGSDIDLSFHMDAWLNQFGYPMLNVTRNGDGTASVTSRQYFRPIGQTPDTPSPYNYSWTVPITVFDKTTTNYDAPPGFWIRYGQSSTTITGLSTNAADWFMINTNQLGFYRVNYDEALRRQIVLQLNINPSLIPAESRAQFVDDSFSLSRTLDIPATWAMDSTQYLGLERTFNAWDAALKHLRYFDRLLQPLFSYSKFRLYNVNTLRPLYDDLGWNYVDMENPLQQLLRREAIANTCYYGLSECVTQAQQLYATFKANPDNHGINPNNLPTVLCVGVNFGDGSDWSLVFEQYQKRRNSIFYEERYAYLFGLACSSDTVWQDRLLNYIVRGELIEIRDQNQALNYMTLSRVGMPIVWNYLDNSWTTVPSTINKLARLRNIILTFGDSSGSIRFNNFVGKYPPTSQSDLESYRQMDLLILENIDWMTANQDELSDWFDAQVPSFKTRTIDARLQLPISPMSAWDLAEQPTEAY